MIWNKLLTGNNLREKSVENQKSSLEVIKHARAAMLSAITLTMPEVCKLLDVSERWVRGEMAAGRFPRPRRMGRGLTRWTLPDIHTWLLGLPVVTGANDETRIQGRPMPPHLRRATTPAASPPPAREPDSSTTPPALTVPIPATSPPPRSPAAPDMRRAWGVGRGCRRRRDALDGDEDVPPVPNGQKGQWVARGHDGTPRRFTDGDLRGGACAVPGLSGVADVGAARIH